MLLSTTSGTSISSTSLLIPSKVSKPPAPRSSCYFSAGTDENWRSDSNQFQSADIGNTMGDWGNEDWINTKSTNVRKIMAARLDLTKSQGCDGVDPDNIDAYNHDTGFNLTQNDAVSYVTYLSRKAS